MGEVPLYAIQRDTHIKDGQSENRQSHLRPVDPSLRALSERLDFTVRRDKFNKESLFIEARRLPQLVSPLRSEAGPAVLYVRIHPDYTLR